MDRDGEVLRSYLADDESRLYWVPLSDIAPRVIDGVIAVEDERFRLHPGVDPISIVRAVGQNLRGGRVVSGASTITMQLVRMLHPRPRSLRGKAIEAFRALQLERLLSKDEILEWYLNLIPCGGNVAGVEAAAWDYFDKGAEELSLAEAALLAGLAQAPSRLRPDRHPERAKVRRDYVLKRMSVCDFITPEQSATAQAQAVQTVRRLRPFDAPHLTRMVRARRPGVGDVTTTLDRDAQSLAEQAIRAQVAALRHAGVTNGAVVIIENETSAVRALVGSCDFRSVRDQGQVNGATALRSPGSALKPFTYALAFERGICGPETVLADVPCNIAGYDPDNYDGSFRGLVTARESLADSLNVPAVRLLERVGAERLLTKLHAFGLDTLNRSAGHYGLALTLGSAEVTLLDLTNAYACLARMGQWQPYRLCADAPLQSPTRVMSEGAAWLVADVLSDPQRMDGRHVRMAWKTGTSWGHRDAWTVAWTPRWTVGVWLGNFRGTASRALVGAEAAAPVAASIMDALCRDARDDWFVRPASVTQRELCTVSGMTPGPCCGSTTSGLGVGKSSSCTVCREVCIDAETGEGLCATCKTGRAHERRVVHAWPPETSAWLRAQGHAERLAPPHRTACALARAQSPPPRIITPVAGRTYRTSSAGLPLRATGRPGKLFWFIDGKLIATARSGIVTYAPVARGVHEIVCADESGVSAKARVTVE